MVFLGLILVAIAAAAGVGVLLDNNDPVTVAAYGQSVSGFTERELFVGGLAVAALFLLGWILIISGFRRSRRLRGELNELDDLRENREAYIESLEAERVRLTRELSQARQEQARPPTTDGFGPAHTTAGMTGETLGGTPTDDLGVRVASSDSSFFRRPTRST
jgi:hypothetical protein